MRTHAALGPVWVFGEVLFDHFPDRKCLGGAPFNFAFHLHHLGIEVDFISAVGDDAEGAEVLQFARRHGFPTSGIQVRNEIPTGAVNVTLDAGGSPTFEIVTDRAFDHIEPEMLSGRDVRLAYFGTLIQRGERSRASLWEALDRLRTRASLLVDLNLRAPFYDAAGLRRTLTACDILKISGEELGEVSRVLSGPSGGAESVRYLMETFRIGLLCVTSGERNLLFEAGRPEPYRCPVFSGEPVVDTVGAGDAFTAMFAACYLAGWPRQTLLERASQFATALCRVPGALPADPEFYSPYRFTVA